MKRLILTLAVMVAATATLLADDESYNMSRGIDAWQQGDAQEAVRYFIKEAEADDSNSEPWLFIAMIMKDEERLGTALSAMNECIKRIPEKNKTDRAKALFLRYGVFEMIGDTLHAERDLLQAAQLQPREIDYQNRLGDFYYHRNMWDIADKYYNQALKIDPQDWYATMGLGRNESERKAFDKALQWYDKAFAIDPDISSVYAFKGESLMGLGRWDEAAECLLNSLEYADQWGSQLFDQLCDSALDVALDALHRRHIAEPTSAMWIEQLGITYFNGNRYAEAKQWIAKTLEENEDADTYPYLALCSARMGDYEGYSEAMKRGEQLDSTSIDMLEVSAMVEMDWGHYDKALEQANKLVDKQIDDASAYLLRGDILLAKGLAAEALDDYITASVLEEDVDKPLLSAGKVYLLQGNEQKARQCFTKIVERYKTATINAYSRVQEAYYYLGDIEQSRAMAQRVQAAKGDTDDNSLIFGLYYALIGDNDAAQPMLELAIDNGLLTPWIMQEPYDIYHLRALPCYNQLLERARHHFHTTE